MLQILQMEVAVKAMDRKVKRILKKKKGLSQVKKMMRMNLVLSKCQQ